MYVVQCNRTDYIHVMLHVTYIAYNVPYYMHYTYYTYVTYIL